MMYFTYLAFGFIAIMNWSLESDKRQFVWRQIINIPLNVQFYIILKNVLEKVMLDT